MKKNIIALSGTHGTGKSHQAYRLAHNVKNKGFNVCVIDELARECPFDINQTADYRTQLWLFCTQIRKEIKLCDKYDYIIVDRSILDAFAYAKVLNLIQDNDIYFIIHAMEAIYKKVYILDPDAFYFHKDDGIRDMDKTFRAKIHEELVKIHQKHSVETKIIFDENSLLEDVEKIIERN